MKRLVLSSFIAFVTFAAAAAEIVPLRRHSVTPRSENPHIFRFDQNDPPLMMVNHSDHSSDVDIAISDASRAELLRRVSLLPNEAIPLAALSPLSDAMVVIDAGGDVDLLTTDGTRFVLRDRRMAEGDAVIIERVLLEPVPFFLANVSPRTLHVDIECDGRQAGVDVAAGQIADFADLFEGFPRDATSAVLRSSSSGAQWLAGVSRSRFGVRFDVPLGRRRRVVNPPSVTDCASALSAYQSALAEMQQFVKTPVVVPTPPKTNYDCSEQGRLDDYAQDVMDPERSRLDVLLTLGRKMDLLGCPVQLGSDITPLLSRLAKKQTLLPPLGDVPEKHMPILAAMLGIERALQLLSYGSGNILLISNTASAWLQADEQYYLKRITEQHDYKGAGTVINLATALALLTSSDSNLEDLLQKLKKAMTFRVKITVETISTFAGMTIRFKSAGEAVVDGIGINDPSGGPISFIEGPGSAIALGQTCSYTPGSPSTSGIYVPLDLCSNPPVKIRIQGLVGSGTPGTWACGIPALGGSIDLFIRSAFNIDPTAIPLKELPFDDKPLHAPAFQNLSATAIDDVWAGTGTWQGWTSQGQVHITMTHEPKQ